MIWFVLAGVCAVIYTVSYVVDDLKSFGRELFSFGEAIFQFVIAVLISGLVAVTLWLCSSVAFSFAEFDYNLTKTKEIVALNDSSAISGRFYLGSGRADEKMKYYFVEETEKGKHIDDVYADNAYIIESNNETPRVEVCAPGFKNDWMYWFAFPMAENEYRIYIPENSITTEFDINLE